MDLFCFFCSRSCSWISFVVDISIFKLFIVGTSIHVKTGVYTICDFTLSGQAKRFSLSFTYGLYVSSGGWCRGSVAVRFRSFFVYFSSSAFLFFIFSAFCSFSFPSCHLHKYLFR